MQVTDVSAFAAYGLNRAGLIRRRAFVVTFETIGGGRVTGDMTHSITPSGPRPVRPVPAHQPVLATACPGGVQLARARCRPSPDARRHLRPKGDADLPFVAALYASTRLEELAITGWPAAQQQAFLSQQHQAQHRHYRGTYRDAQWLIIERGEAAVGRLYRFDWQLYT